MGAKRKKKSSKDNFEQKPKLTNVEMKEIELMKKWEEARKLGQFKYVLLKGTLAWTVLTSSVFIILTLITNKFLINKEILMYFLNMVIVFIGMGTLFGFISWRLSEKRYHLFKSKNLKDK